MGLPENEVAADNRRRRMEEISKSPIGGVIGNVISVARPALAVGSTVVTSGATVTGLAVAGGIVGGLGIVDWFRRLGSSKVNENLESLGQATEEALSRVENTLRKHGTSIDEIKARIESPEFKNGIASASLQALRTTQRNRLNRMAFILANGVKEDDLEPENLDDMMRAAVELKDADVVLLGKIYESQKSILNEPRMNPTNWFGQVQTRWNEFVDSGALDASKHLVYRSSLSRLESHGLIQKFREISTAGVGLEPYALLVEGMKFYERLQEIAVPK
jgi:DNA-binding transcriptional MerR regulator